MDGSHGHEADFECSTVRLQHNIVQQLHNKMKKGIYSFNKNSIAKCTLNYNLIAVVYLICFQTYAYICMRAKRVGHRHR